MPNYVTGGKAKLLHDNHQYYFWQTELVLAATASIAFQLERIRAAFYPFGVSYEVAFTAANGVTPANPGAFQIDFQHADTDNDANYVTVASISGGLNASFVGRYELPACWMRYCRALIVTNTNGVYVTAKVTR